MVGRALKQLGIGHIAAYSPQAINGRAVDPIPQGRRPAGRRGGALRAGLPHEPHRGSVSAGADRSAIGGQDRLPKELQLAGITTVAAANRYLREVYLAEHNARFAVGPEQPASAFVPAAPELWRDLLCVQEERPSAGSRRPLLRRRIDGGPSMVGNNNCVRWRGRALQIPPSPLQPHFARSTVRLHEYPDGTIAIFKGPHRLASFPPAAEPQAQDLAA